MKYFWSQKSFKKFQPHPISRPNYPFVSHHGDTVSKVQNVENKTGDLVSWTCKLQGKKQGGGSPYIQRDLKWQPIEQNKNQRVLAYTHNIYEEIPHGGMPTNKCRRNDGSDNWGRYHQWMLTPEVRLPQERGCLCRFKILVNYQGKIITVGNPGGRHLNRAIRLSVPNETSWYLTLRCLWRDTLRRPHIEALLQFSCQKWIISVSMWRNFRWPKMKYSLKCKWPVTLFRVMRE